MNRYPNTEASFSQLLKKSFRLHYLTLKHTIFFILLITVVKYAVTIAMLFSLNDVVRFIVCGVATLLFVYLFSAALLATHEAFMDRSKTFFDTLVKIKKNAVKIYATFFAYIVGILCAYGIAKLLTIVVYHFLDKYFTATHGVTLILSATLLVMFIAMFLFSYPLVVIESKKIINAFYDSLVLSDRCKFGIFFLFFLMLVVDMLISPMALQEYFLSTYHLGVLYDFVVLCVMMPLFINLLLLLIHDAKLQLMAEGEI